LTPARQVLLVKLAAIREQKANKSPPGDGVRQPRNAEEAKARFWEGMREMEARNDEAAFQIFDVLSCYEGDAPPHLVAIAKAGRNFLDPERTAEQKARTMFDYFTPTLISIGGKVG
jgi:predicted RNA-binding protein with PUA-like domain